MVLREVRDRFEEKEGKDIAGNGPVDAHLTDDSSSWPTRARTIEKVQIR